MISLVLVLSAIVLGSLHAQLADVFSGLTRTIKRTTTLDLALEILTMAVNDFAWQLQYFKFVSCRCRASGETSHHCADNFRRSWPNAR